MHVMNKDTKFCVRTADRVPVQIARFLRGQIQSGALKPGERLPTTDDLVQQWQVGRVSAHRALALLAADGLIERKRHEGTFVRNEVNKGIIGVVIGPDLAEESIHFHRAIIRAIQSALRGMSDRNWSCRIYDGVTGGDSRQSVAESQGYQDIVRDIQSYSFKGIIQIIGDMTAKQVAALQFNLPTVRLGPSLEGTTADVMMDLYRFGEDCVKYIAGKGLRKIAYLRARLRTRRPFPDLEGVRRTAALLGLPKILSYHAQPDAPGGYWLERAAYARTLELIAEWERDKNWPEALLVPDDIAMKGVALALVRKGIEVPGRLLVVTMANEGIYHHYGIPVMRYENSPSAVANALFDILWKRIVNAKQPQLPVKIAGHLQTQNAILSR